MSIPFYTIENDILQVVISAKGAEIQSIINKDFGIEYMWSGDSKFWGKKSPVLFPVVGGLKENKYSFNGKTFELGRHGFARDMTFVVTAQDETSVTFGIQSGEETHIRYPFDFRFFITYTLQGSMLRVAYSVHNTGNEKIYFSVGGHPAFAVPLVINTTFEDYYLQFSSVENAGKWPLSGDGLIEEKPVPFLENTDELALQKELFYEDALVFKNLQSNRISLLSNKTSHGLVLQFDGFPYMGIWSAKNADFVCIEPWCGIADSVNASGKLEEKEGINSLAAGETFAREWTAEFF
ncbi:aldose 1-epimerase family protein [Danxiaibacter flavus]|uniref:Aldose 1-epimerase family protein n=1 Tax=Danxiaibacter flavus TaxID=3049108 RepID=A0ABV3ZFQ5_9BACT|nr:aldose 1-epimerase family protein [Chitinophagaceae bacterium DXS]